MKETKDQTEVKKENKNANKSKMEESIDKTIKSLSEEDLRELKNIVSGRKFCKKGRRFKDIIREELERYEYENNSGIFTKLFKHRVFKKKKEQLMLECRVYSIIRTVIAECIDEIREDERYVPIRDEELINKVKEKILK